MEEQEKLIIETLVAEVKVGNLQIEEIPLVWREKVEMALANKENAL